MILILGFPPYPPPPKKKLKLLAPSSIKRPKTCPLENQQTSMLYTKSSYSAPISRRLHAGLLAEYLTTMLAGAEANIWFNFLLQHVTTRYDVRQERCSFCAVLQSLPPNHSFAWQRSSHH